MSKYIIRLDDACPNMNHENWNRMEHLLDEYNVSPIVGVIPENRDSDFSWETDPDFWGKVGVWQKKGWTIALHGLHHTLQEHEPGRGYYQKSHSVHTEFAGISLDMQYKMLKKGIQIMEEHGIAPTCFFAPAHTYDTNTVRALRKCPEIQFVSDGYAIQAFRKDGMVFLPSICDGPFTMPFGLYTYVFHPSMMKEASFTRLEDFLKKNCGDIIDTTAALAYVRESQGIIGCLLENGVYFARKIRLALKLNRRKQIQ